MIKDQCNNCKKNGTSNCGQTIIFNSLPCEFYVKRFDLSKPTAPSTPSSSPTINPAPNPAPVTNPGNSSTYNANVDEPSLWKSLFSFNGRIRRTRYWLTSFGISLLFLPSNLASEDDMPAGVAIFTLMIFLPAMWVSFANIAKRCHDLGKSGFMGFLLIIPIVNFIFGIYLGFFQGDQNDNEYGPSPY